MEAHAYLLRRANENKIEKMVTNYELRMEKFVNYLMPSDTAK